MTDEMAQLYASVRESEESYEKVKSENEELRQKNITLTKANELILKRVEDIEKEANVMQDKPQTGNWRHYSNNNNVNWTPKSLVHMIKQTKFLGKLNLSETRSSLVIQILEA